MPAPRQRLLPLLVLAAGTATALTAAATAPASSAAAADQVWPAFVLVLGLLLVGFAAAEDGAFAAMAHGLHRLPGGRWVLYAASMLLVAAVSVLLNLDTAVAFLTPVLVLLARRRRSDEQLFLYGCVFMANSASLLLPGSNLTNLIVLEHGDVSGATFAARLWPPWLVAVAVTALVPVLLLRRRGAPATPPAPGNETHRPWLSGVAIAAVATAMLILSAPALPVLAVGIVTVVALFARDAAVRTRMAAAVDVVTVTGLFGLAVAAGALGRVWLGPAHALAGTGRLATAAIGAAGAVLLNNLPAAALLSAHPVAHPRALLVGLNVGPNIAVTGSLSAVLWLQAARLVDSPTSARRYTAVGITIAAIAVPLAVLAL